MKRLTYLLLVFLAMTSCNAIYEYEGDCDPKYRIEFKYDYNIKYADAFANEVKSVSLYAFDGNGRLVYQKTDQGAHLGTGDYVMEVDMEPGTYDLVAWCGLEDGSSFALPVMQAGLTNKSDMACTIKGKKSGGQITVDQQIKPLFHGALNSVEFPDDEGVHTFTIPLIKNTNSIRIVLQHISGKKVDPDLFTYHITDDNEVLNWNNEIVPSNIVNYEAYYTATGEEVLSKADSVPTAAATAVADLAVSRLMASSNARLTIKRLNGQPVLSIPVVDFLMLVKSYYKQAMTDQEYLDRQDDFYFLFFLQDKKTDPDDPGTDPPGGGTNPDDPDDPDDPEADYTWMNTYIYIGSWRVVLSNTTL